jgi:hypothetical protein
VPEISFWLSAKPAKLSNIEQTTICVFVKLWVAEKSIKDGLRVKFLSNPQDPLAVRHAPLPESVESHRFFMSRVSQGDYRHLGSIDMAERVGFEHRKLLINRNL